MPGSCSYVGGNPSKNLCCEFRRIFEREKLVANILEVGEHEIQISQQRVLVPWLLCRYCHIFLWALLTNRINLVSVGKFKGAFFVIQMLCGFIKLKSAICRFFCRYPICDRFAMTRTDFRRSVKIRREMNVRCNFCV